LSPGAESGSMIATFGVKSMPPNSIFIGKERKKMKGTKTFVQMLLEDRVEAIFGSPGGTSLPLFEAFYDAAPKIRHIMARDELSLWRCS
jgi:hypothetical protein